MENAVKGQRPGLASTFRPEIQALRALAVLFVVLYHLWPQVLTGGFVGVDVFFVVSGYLITGHLVREKDRRGRIALAEFWARRARRLLPASLLVLFVSAVLVLIFVPQIFWEQFFRETIASALYVENWVLSSDAVDYLAANNVATAAQHYWSLSVEEQFYIVWPLLIVAAAAAAKKLVRIKTHTLIAITLGVVTLVSIVYSIYLTRTDPASAYFVTPVRAWEFGAGGLLALARNSDPTKAAWLKSAVAWLGWLVLVVVAVRYSSATPFPGITAIVPVAATVGIIWAGAPRRFFSPTRLVELRPVQWVGGISYSTYLWHWPLIVIAPYVLGYAQLALLEKSSILAITVVLAWLTKLFVEDPVREGPLLSGRRPRFTLFATAAAIVVVVVPSAIGGVVVQQRTDQEATIRHQLALDTCFGAASLDPTLECGDAKFPVISPDPALAPQDSPGIYFTHPPCFAATTAVQGCQVGDATGRIRIALIGDSHAAQWEPALAILARKYHWQVTTFLKTNCAFTDVKRSSQYAACDSWSRHVSKKLSQQKPYDLVITSFFAQNLNLEISAGSVKAASATKGFRDVWKPIVKRGTPIVVLHDTPHMRANTTVCVALHGDGPECNVPAPTALASRDLEFDAATGTIGVHPIDLSDYFCSKSVCFAVIGGVAVHTDPYHTTQTYSKTLAPYLYQALSAMITSR